MLAWDHTWWEPVNGGQRRVHHLYNTKVNRENGANSGGFTLVEIMIVLTILTALMAMGFGGYRHLRENAARDATRAVVEAIANAIAVRGPELTVQNGATTRTVAVWDVDEDGRPDGPQINLGSLADAALATALRNAGYAGLTAEVVDLPTRFRDSAGQPIDAWQRPLRYAYAPMRRQAGGSYSRDSSHLIAAHRNGAGTDANDALAEHLGAKGFVVWSAGLDGNDFTADDIITAP